MFTTGSLGSRGRRNTRGYEGAERYASCRLGSSSGASTQVWSGGERLGDSSTSTSQRLPLPHDRTERATKGGDHQYSGSPADLGCDDLEWERGKAWAFEQSMGAAWYYAESNPAMSLMGQLTLQRIVADPSLA